VSAARMGDKIRNECQADTMDNGVVSYGTYISCVSQAGYVMYQSPRMQGAEPEQIVDKSDSIPRAAG